MHKYSTAEAEKITTNERIAMFKNFMGQYCPPDMLEFLINRGFFTAPASTKYHGNYEGGLFDHSFEVANQLVHYTGLLGLEWSNPRSPFIVGMFHDLCKLDAYQKTDAGYAYTDSDSFTGHGEKSVLVLSQIMRLTEEEVYCIRYHMGAYEKDEWAYYDRAIRKYPNVLWTHTADMVAAKIQGI